MPRSILRPPPSPHLPFGTVIGGYRLEGLIYGGAASTVYYATRGTEKFALKLAHDGWASASLEERQARDARMQRDAVSMMEFEHPGVVRVHGFGRWPDPVSGAFYLVMDLVEGVPLMGWYRLQRPSLYELLHVVLRLGWTLEALHRREVVHGDITSDNILIQPNLVPVLVDFGPTSPTPSPDFARELLKTEEDGWWAPELLAKPAPHFDYTPATDLYALGCLFFLALTGGETPPGHEFMRLLARRGQGHRTHPSHLVGGIPRDIDAPVMRLLATRPEERTPSGRALAEELTAILAADNSLKRLRQQTRLTPHVEGRVMSKTNSRLLS